MFKKSKLKVIAPIFAGILLVPSLASAVLLEENITI